MLLFRSAVPREICREGQKSDTRSQWMDLDCLLDVFGVNLCLWGPKSIKSRSRAVDEGMLQSKESDQDNGGAR